MKLWEVNYGLWNSQSMFDVVSKFDQIIGWTVPKIFSNVCLC